MNAKKCKELRRIVRRQVPADKRATRYKSLNNAKPFAAGTDPVTGLPQHRPSHLQGGTLRVTEDCARGYYLLLKRVARQA